MLINYALDPSAPSNTDACPRREDWTPITITFGGYFGYLILLVALLVLIPSLVAALVLLYRRPGAFKGAQ